MIITCPQCSARYKIKDELVNEKGKKVKCKKCETVFIAYPGDRSVLKSTPEETNPPVSAQSSVAKEKPAASEAQARASNPAKSPKVEDVPSPPTHQATVKVDRSKLDGYFKQAQAEERPVSAPRPASSNSDGQATIQVDRSQIDAYIKQARKAEEQPIQANATVHIDRSALMAAADADNQDNAFADDDSSTIQVKVDRFSQTAPVSSADADINTIRFDSTDDFPSAANYHSGGSETLKIDLSKMPPPGGGMDTIKMDTGAVLGMQKSQITGREDSDINFDTGENGPISSFDDNPDFDTDPSFSERDLEGPDGFEGRSSQKGPFETENNLEGHLSDEPAFPSDEELGISQDGLGQSLVDDDPFGRTDPFASYDGEQHSSSAAASDNPTLGHDEPVYSARVDGKTYSNLSLESLGRWILEERLLESDLIDNGSGHFVRADEYPEIVPFFQQFYALHGEGPQIVEPEKKGFFAKLLSIFKK